jgi:NADH dehydrogenase (ubiquinone) Fe-S protein 3
MINKTEKTNNSREVKRNTESLKLNFLNISKKYAEYLMKILPIYSYVIHHMELVLYVPVKKLNQIAYFLKNHTFSQYTVLTDISGVDYPTRGLFRFDVVYFLLSIRYNSRIKLKIAIDEKTNVPSLTNIYMNANWSEREVFDLFGIQFENHTDLRRILTDYGFKGHPMKKDFPLVGFVEVRYDDTLSQIVYEPVQLSQIGYGYHGQKIIK